jgi:hypothetical protein
MPSTLSLIGILHTLISIVSMVTGAIALIRSGYITLGNRVGQVYLATMLITCATSFMIFARGYWTIGHTLTVVSVAVLALGVFGDLRKRANLRDIGMGLSYFLLWFFAVTEAMTRLPISQPLAADQNDPSMALPRGIMLLMLVAGVAFQIRRNRRLLS